MRLWAVVGLMVAFAPGCFSVVNLEVDEKDKSFDAGWTNDATSGKKIAVAAFRLVRRVYGETRMGQADTSGLAVPRRWNTDSVRA